MESFFHVVLLLAALGAAAVAGLLYSRLNRERRESQEAKLEKERLKAEKKALEADLDTACQQLSELFAERDRLRRG